MNSEQATFLNKKRQTVTLSDKQNLSHDTRRFRFSLPSKDLVLGLPVGKHFKVYCPNKVGVVANHWNGREDPEAGKTEIQRSYTPTTSNDDLGYFDLVIKVYSGGVIDRFPDGGKASQYFESLKVGDTVDIAGPFGLVEYKGNGNFEFKRKAKYATHIGMIAGGTGITPMLQIIAAVLKNPEDKTKLSLLYANQTEEDILVRDLLENLQQKHPEQFSLWYTLDRPNAEWTYSQGFINKEMVENHLPAPSDTTVILMCGPPPMIKFACVPNLTEVGHAEEK
eukprot:CAMPEP_0117029582 /NCGR_PEP_ID=MMETSP0472-20121206/21407_1 /TAXON_ID=693140 ORGANISM="Tiarina fusus, Strain LIS" /NCGR_SAMPLE_ID=MMETSP0472 /ASSEMBLY_ACC=CAM_ASM_000603 /LENGTH=279 /DNA_ID=CAMNT_0004737385 /DNA_START=148 /DNA_END=984 /DNA_ORIENTATION=+